MEFGFVQIGPRRVYVEMLTDTLREGMTPEDRAYAERMAMSGSTVAVMYEAGSPPMIGMVSPAAVTEMTREDFAAHRDAGWVEPEPGVSGGGAGMAMGGELSLEVNPQPEGSP